MINVYVTRCFSWLWVALVFSLVVVASAASDPRIVVFDKFNRAQNYDEIKPLVSGLFAQQFAVASAKPEVIKRYLKSLQVNSYEPRIVDINDTTSFLVFEHSNSTAAPLQRVAYVLSRSDGQWKVAGRTDPRSVIKSIWVNEFSPSDFNQSSTCSVESKRLGASVSGKRWKLESAVAMRTRDEIEIDLLSFPLKDADLNYWKFSSGMPVDLASFANSSVSHFQPECRIIFGLDQNGQVRFANVGFNHPEANFSEVWQGPGWASLHFQPTGGKGLPPEFRKLEITRDRIAVQTEGHLEAGGDTIRWNVDIAIPLWEKGL